LQFVNVQNNDICKLAIQQDKRAMQYVKNKTNELRAFSQEHHGIMQTLCKLISHILQYSIIVIIACVLWYIFYSVL